MYTYFKKIDRLFCMGFNFLYILWPLFLLACSSDLESTQYKGTRLSCFEMTTSETGQKTIIQYLSEDAQGPCPKDVEIPEGIRKIGIEAFANLDLTSVQFPESITRVAARAFAGNLNLVTVQIPNVEVVVVGGSPNKNATLEVFPNGYFIGGTRLSCFEFEAEENSNNSSFTHYVVTNYKESDEQGPCPKEVLLPKGMNIIGPEAFLNRNITKFEILGSVQEVRERAFMGNPDIPPIHIKYFIIPVVANDAFPNGWYHGNDADCYKIKGGRNGKITAIEYKRYNKEGGVEGCDSSVTIPYGVTHIGAKAGFNKFLSRVTLSSTVTHIGASAFSFNTSISSVDIPASVVSIGENAFSSNIIESVTFRNGLNSIGKSAFTTNRLTAVTIPDNVTSIGPKAFLNNSIETVTFGNSVNEIGHEAFANNLISTVTIPDAVTVIESSVFSNNDLTNVILGSSVTTIKRFAFSDDLNEGTTISSLIEERGDNRITGITFPSTLTTIEHGAFFGNALTSVTIPDSVTEIQCDVFRNNSLSSVNLGTGIDIIGPGAFLGNDFNAVELPSQNVDIYSTTFDTGVSLTVTGGDTFDTSLLTDECPPY